MLMEGSKQHVSGTSPTVITIGLTETCIVVNASVGFGHVCACNGD